MYSLNRVHLIGYQTQPVEVRTTPSGSSVTDLNLVVPYTFTAADGQLQTSKGFHTITLWSKMAEIAGQYVRAGSQLFVSGRLQTDSWEDEQSKEKRNKTKIISLDMLMLDSKDGQMAAPANAPLVSGALNRAEIIGNVTRDPEVRATTTGQQVVSLGVATNERWRDKGSGEDRERTEYHNIVIWGDLGQQFANIVKKGNKVYIAGRVQTRTWETQTGEKRATTEIVADQANILGTANPIVLDNISSSGAAPAMNQDSGADSMNTPPADTSTNVPDVQYASEVKVEDLPF